MQKPKMYLAEVIEYLFPKTIKSSSNILGNQCQPLFWEQ
ncbi:hypothetical protein SynBIOSE41_01000 [Synechococcus sp. BIOS-E4-1]|nr:hypothetical protein SynBIOSE41_01000 [Synechococcus sp. BIOS-E4-1]